MPRVRLMELDEPTIKIHLLKEVELASIPIKSDKVIVDIAGIDYIFKVFDVHYADHLLTHVLIVKIGNVIDYNERIGGESILGLAT
jgi:hypothetical protein